MFVTNFQIFAYFCWEKPKITMKKILRGVFYYGRGERGLQQVNAQTNSWICAKSIRLTQLAGLCAEEKCHIL
jgi:hypothetical protein